jgi:hypothetical protein
LRSSPLLSSPCASPLSLKSLPLVWLPEWLRRSEDYSIAACRCAAGIPDLIQTDLLLQSRLDQRSGGHHHSPYVYEYSEVLPFVQPGRCAGVVATSSSTRPCGRLRWLHHQRMCGSIIPAFGLQGYVTEVQLIVTIILIDRSWAIRDCVGNNFFVSIEPQHQQRFLSDLCRFSLCFVALCSVVASS